MREKGGSDPDGRRMIFVGLACFVGTVVAVVVLVPTCRAGTHPRVRYAVSERARAVRHGVLRVTLDARDTDRWVGFDFSSGRRTAPAAADLLVRRYELRAPGGAADLGLLGLSRVDSVPVGRWIQDADGRGALSRWYEYSYWTHQLRTRGHTYAVRLRPSKGIAFFEVVSYDCAPAGSGCVTLRYRLGEGGIDGR